MTGHRPRRGVVLPKLTLEEALSRLTAAGIEPLNIEDMQNGKRVICRNAAIVNVYDTGSVNVQGKPAARPETEMALGAAVKVTAEANNKVFVVYGHNDAVKTELQLFLHKLGLEPIIVGDLPKRGRTLIESLEYALSMDPAFTLVLWTPDDKASPVADPGKEYLQPRPNVIFELGLAIGRFKREKVGILWQNTDNFEDPSDLKGIFSIRFNKGIHEIQTEIIKDLVSAGLPVDVDKFFGKGAKK
jgi:predicted nucleotide-binding protein